MAWRIHSLESLNDDIDGMIHSFIDSELVRLLGRILLIVIMILGPLVFVVGIFIGAKVALEVYREDKEDTTQETEQKMTKKDRQTKRHQEYEQRETQIQQIKAILPEIDAQAIDSDGKGMRALAAEIRVVALTMEQMAASLRAIEEK